MGAWGEIYQAYGFDDAALACYANAAKLEPRSFGWRMLRRLSSPTERRHGVSLPRISASSDSATGNASTMLRLGNLELSANHLDSARAWFAKALALRNSSPAAALTGLGKVALIEQKYPAALKYFREALARSRKRRASITSWR